MSDWPTRILRVAPDGWLYDPETSQWARVEGYDYNDKVSLEDGWLRAWLPAEPEEPKGWEWPEAWDEPWASGTYSQMYPTRYNWRADVERVARRVVDAFPGLVWANTYVNHPPGWWRDETSIDFWAYAGRGSAINESVGQQVFDFIFEDPNPPHIEWTIWWGDMWTRSGGWQAAPPGPADSDPGHYSHIHVTYLD